ncbi:MAG: hypothetical protein ACFB21_15485 [Opitutales bacterium]
MSHPRILDPQLPNHYGQSSFETNVILNLWILGLTSCNDFTLYGKFIKHYFGFLDLLIGQLGFKLIQAGVVELGLSTRLKARRVAGGVDFFEFAEAAKHMKY